MEAGFAEEGNDKIEIELQSYRRMQEAAAEEARKSGTGEVDLDKTRDDGDDVLAAVVVEVEDSSILGPWLEEVVVEVHIL